MSTLAVSLGDVRVGTLERFEDEHHVFSFDAAWLADPDRPVLGQFFEDRKPRDVEVWGPISWFAHLLPQGPLRRAVAREAGVDEEDVFELLQTLGEDLPGAVIVRPGPSPLPRPRRGGPPARPEALQYTAGGALAGAQWKLSVRTGERGLVLPVGGESGSWIAKFHDPSLPDLPRIEFATAQWACASGVSMPALRLGRADEIAALPAGIPVGDGSIYLIERFDRGPDGRRIHMEDFGQVLDRPPGGQQFNGTCEQVGAVLAAVAPGDLRAYCERLVFCVLCGNTDAHLKNWSLLYADGRRPRLSPAYDLVASVLYVPGLDDCLALPIGGSARFEDVRVASFERLATLCRLELEEVAGWVRAAAERTREVFSRDASGWGFRAGERERLERHMRRVPLPG